MDVETISSFRELLKQQDECTLREMLAAGESRLNELEAMVESLTRELTRRGKALLS